MDLAAAAAELTGPLGRIRAGADTLVLAARRAGPAQTADDIEKIAQAAGRLAALLDGRNSAPAG